MSRRSPVILRNAKPAQLFRNRMKFCTKTEEMMLSSSEWRPIYRFKQIWVAAAINKMKLVQTAVTVIAAPGAFAFHLTGNVSFELAVGITIAACVACLMLYVMSNFFRRLVGVISIHKKSGDIRIG